MQPNFEFGLELPSQTEYSHAFASAIKRMGPDFLCYYTNSVRENTALEAPALEVNSAMRRLAKECGCKYSVSCHTVSPSLEVMAENKDDSDFMGVVFDEIEHCRCLWRISDEPLIEDGASVKTLPNAYEQALAGYRKCWEQTMKQGGKQAVATHIWPVMHHLSARAGFTVCPKLCKELYSPVSFAVGLGAALQYGVPLWADIDLWFYSMIPGHPPEELRQNLEFAYRMGVDAAYVEGCGLNLLPAGHQGIPFSMFHTITDKLFQLTPHGEVVRSFLHEYIPSHPRDYTFRDLSPSIAIIRFEDTCHGQRYIDPMFGDKLYGLDFSSTEETEEWLKIWDVITAGATGSDGLTYFKSSQAFDGRAVEGDTTEFMQNYTADSLFTGRHRFFCPQNGAVVYDHLVGYEAIKDCKLIFLAGLFLSEDTIAAVYRAVEEGAVCVMTRSMAQKLDVNFDPLEPVAEILKGRQGRFFIAKELKSHALLVRIRPFLGSSDKISYSLRDGRKIEFCQNNTDFP